MIRDDRRAAVVDPGDAEPVVAYLAAEGLELEAILVTHRHPDHVGGVADLAKQFGAPVLGPALEPIPARTRALADGEDVELPALAARFAVMHIPGHTLGHIAFAGEVGGQPVLFCGDTLFAGGCGRLFEGTPAQMHASLARLAALPGATQVYCGHEYTLANLRFAQAVEPESRALAARIVREQAKRARDLPTLPSTIDEERATNPFLRAHVAEVRAAAERHAGRSLDGEVAVLAAVRRWKDDFR